MKPSLIILIIMSICLNAMGNTYYFSSAGNDSYTSSQAQNQATPWKSVTKLNSFFSSLQPGDSVLFKRGDTFYGQIVINKSGTLSQPIVLGAYGTGGKPIITGFIPVTSWDNKGGGVWESTTAISTLRALNMVTIDGVQYEMGRYPNASDSNKGYLTADAVTPTSITDAALPVSPNWAGATAVVRTEHWVIDTVKINSHNGSTINLRRVPVDTPKAKWGYFIENHPATLNNFGEWYYNSATKTLRMYFGADTPTNYVVKASTVDTVIYNYNRDYINFDNLKIEGANLDGLYIYSALNVSITNCEFNFIGNRAAVARTDCHNFKFENNFISDAGNFGLDARANTNNHIIRNNLIKKIGLFPGMGGTGSQAKFGIAYNSGSNHLIEYNRLDSLGYIGIRFDGNHTVVRNNIISNFTLTLDDGSAIYSGNQGATIDVGRKIYNNLIYNGIGTKEGTTNTSLLASNGIYMDDSTNGVEIYNNSIWNCGRAGLYLHNCFNINVHDNIIFDNDQAQVELIHDSKKYAAFSNIIYKNNIAFAKTSKQTVAYFYTRLNDIATFGTIDSNIYARPVDDSVIIRGITYVYSDSAISKRYTLDAWKAAYGHDTHSKKSPKRYAININPDDSIRFEYNPTNTVKTISLGAHSYITPDSIRYSGSITLQPYTSIILMKDASVSLSPLADAYVQNGTFAAMNFGSSDTLSVKTTTTSNLNRRTYLKFSLDGIADISKATLRIYGGNRTDASFKQMDVYSVDTDTWAENAITWNNAPAASTTPISSVNVNNELKYYDLDVTDYIRAQHANDKIASLMLKSTVTSSILLQFNSRESGQNTPQLIIVSPTTTTPLADSYVRNGAYDDNNYGDDDSISVKTYTNSTGYTRNAYLKFPLANVGNIKSARLRLFGRNTTDATSVSITAYGVDDDSWIESGITWNNAPAAVTTALSSVLVNNQAQYYDLDVTDFVKAQFSNDKEASFVIKDAANKNKVLVFNSKENGQNPPQLIVDYTDTNQMLLTQYANAVLQAHNKNPFVSFVEDTNKEIRVFPNPANENLTMMLPDSYKGDILIQVVDVMGRSYGMRKYNVLKDGYNLSIRTSDLRLTPGTYFLNVSSNNNSKSIKFIYK